MIALDDLRLLLRIAELGNLSAAARQLGWLPATASASLRRVERELGARLFDRSTRSMRPTEAGARYLDRCRSALAALDEGAEGLQLDRARLSGPLRIAAPSDFGRSVLSGWLDEFCADHPALLPSLQLSDHLSDLKLENLDFALRFGRLDDSSLVRQHLASAPRAVAGSPDYFQRHGFPAVPADLLQHRCLVLLRRGEPLNPWLFWGEKGELAVNVTGARFADDGAVLRSWALAGQGLVYKSWLDLAPDVAAGRLQIALPGWYRETVPLQLLSLARQFRPRRLSLFADYLVARCSGFASTHPFPDGF